uniref:Uncharacterized protein n=1 Tax=Glossina palpalis gambiensis TaxID=67801 RepID=A0A1B0C1V0_9MUSC
MFHVCMLHHMADSKIGKRIQSTVAAQVEFFSPGGSCGSVSTHRINLFGYALFMLLKGINWRETEDENISWYSSACIGRRENEQSRRQDLTCRKDIHDNIRKYQQLLLLIISCISIGILLMYEIENNRLKDVLHVNISIRTLRIGNATNWWQAQIANVAICVQFGAPFTPSSFPYDELTIIPAGFDVTPLNTYHKKLIGIIKNQCVGIM